MNLPMINSTNSVSTSKRKREAERSVNWTVEETQVLLCAWSDERIQKSLAENLRNRHVFKLLSVRMCELGFARSPHQCRLRVKTLKANYVRAKLQRSAGGGQQPCSFKYFAEMDAVLGRRASDGGRHLGSNGVADGGCHLGSNGVADGGRHLGSNGVVGEDRGRHLGSNNLGMDGGRHLGSSDMAVDGGRHLVSKATGADRGRHLGSKFFATAALSLRTAGLRPGADAGGARFAAFLDWNDDNSGRLVPLIASAVAGTESVEPPAWQPEAEVKMEDLENSTDEYEYEYGDTSLLQTGVYHNPDGTLSELHHRAPSPLALPQMPPPMPPPPAPSPLPPPTMDPTTTTTNNNNNNNNNNIGSSSSRTTPHSSSSSSSSAPPPRPEGPGACAGAGAGPGGPGSLAGAEPALGHLSQCFQRLVEETRGLLVQLEAQRQEQARGHQELLAHWLEREERRQREAADREERRERARMAHEIRVLELLGGLARQGAGPGAGAGPGPWEGRCRCGGRGAGVGEGPGEAATDSLHHSSKEER